MRFTAAIHRKILRRHRQKWRGFANAFGKFRRSFLRGEMSAKPQFRRL
jgi:hypothetical protein